MIEIMEKNKNKVLYDAGYLQGQSDALNNKLKCNRKLEIELSLCSYCGCMTKIIGVEGYCGKCKKPKKEGLMS